MDSKEINIPSTIQDVNYRYRMPRMIIKSESRGNGVKTNITNLVDVAKALDVPVDYILKFFSLEKGTLLHDKTSDKDNSSIINGNFSYEDLLKVLDVFINKYVCCPKCTYPEMDIRVKSKRVTGICKSCSFSGELDNTHKLASYIIKHPPPTEKEEKPEYSRKKAPAPVEPVVEKTKQQKNKIKKLTKDDLMLSGQLLSDISASLRNFFAEKCLTEKDNDLLAADLTVEIKSHNVEKTLVDRLAYLIFNAIFTVNMHRQLKDYSKFYKIMLNKFNVQNQPVETLMNVEYLLLVKNQDPKVHSFIATIMNLLYEEELLTDEVLLKWEEGKEESVLKHFLYDKGRDDTFKTHAKEFLNWLKQPEEDEEEEEEAKPSAPVEQEVAKNGHQQPTALT